MYNYMIAHPSLQAASLPQAGDFLIAAGVINPGSNVAGFSYLRRSDNVVNVPALVPGDYSLRLLDGSDNVLADYAFTPELNEDTGTLGFSQVVDFVAGTRKVQVVKLDGDVVLATQAVSANPPTISDVALQGAPDPVDGVVTLGWSASDPDAGDTLSFDVAYSRDGGATFQPVTLNLSGNSAQIDTASLGGSGTAILRVTASDGVNSAYADSAPFIMANKPPVPAIQTPENNLHIHYGQLVNFSGMAMDAQDGTVADAGLTWWDANTDTMLGTGPLLSLDNLPVGENTIVLQATNSVGASATANVTVYVDDDLSLPGPTLTAGPSPVGWQVNAGSTDLQTADIAINNSGSGDLTFNASVDASWLSTDVVSATVSADGDAFMLTLSADPSGLAAGSTYSANLTISSDGLDPVQTVVIPVSLSVGDVHSVAPAEREIFLPFIRK
jgi:Viral BACON domain